jgi:hypothetical protein
MIECAGFEIRFVCEREKRDTRTDARSQNPDLLKTFVLQPAHRCARVEHCLPH